MALFLSVAAVLLALFGAYIVVMNDACAYVSLRNRRRGIDRHHSMVPLVAQICLGIAGMLSSVVPPWLLWIVALSDISLWTLPYSIIYALRHQ